MKFSPCWNLGNFRYDKPNKDIDILSPNSNDGNHDMNHTPQKPTRFHFGSRIGTALLLATLVIGCGKKDIYPVRGQIVDPNGNPIGALQGGAIEFEAIDGMTSANSSIDENGNFRLTTMTPGDGSHVGKNRVVITRRYVGPETPVPHVILPKYEKFETSGLEATVEPKDNVLTIQVELDKGGN